MAIFMLAITRLWNRRKTYKLVIAHLKETSNLNGFNTKIPKMEFCFPWTDRCQIYLGIH